MHDLLQFETEMPPSPVSSFVVNAECAALHDVQRTRSSSASSRGRVDAFLSVRTLHNASVATRVAARREDSDLLNWDLITATRRTVYDRWDVRLLLKITDDCEVSQRSDTADELLGDTTDLVCLLTVIPHQIPGRLRDIGIVLAPAFLESVANLVRYGLQWTSDTSIVEQFLGG